MNMTQEKKFAKSQQKQYLPTQGNNAPLLNLSDQKPSLRRATPTPKREPIKHIIDWFTKSRYQHNSLVASSRLCQRW